MATINEIVLQCVLDNSFDLVELAWSSGMAWWMASLIFCATITSRLYFVKQSMIDKGLHTAVGVLVSMCFLAMILFGVVVIRDLGAIESAMHTLIINNLESFTVPNLSSIFTIVQKLYTIITCTILVFLFGWIYVWFYNKPFKLIKK